MPGTDDLLILWNQVSGDEIERGRQRHRLTAAVSQDGGATWKFRKNVGALDGDETTYIEPPPIRSYRAANYTPRLPYNDRVMDYPSMYIGKDRVIINTKFKERGPGHRSAASRQGSTDHYYAGPTPSVVLPGMTSARYGQDVTPRKD